MVSRMAQFTYEVVSKEGKNRKGTIEADNLEKAKDILRAEGNTILKLSEAGVLNQEIKIGGKKSVNSRDLSVFCRQFVSILRAGVNIITALGMLGDQTESKTLKEAILNIKNSVEKGSSLAEAFRKEKGLFPGILISMIEAGEASGSLEVALERMSTHFEKDARIKGMVKKALMYPCVLIVVCIAVMVVMLVVVIPNFESMFDQIGGELPGFTKAVVALSESLQKNWLIWIAVIGAVVVAFNLYKRTESGSRTVARIIMKVPVFGMLGVKTACSRFARTLSTLIAAGMPMIEAIEITAKTMDNVLFRDALEEAARQVQRGMALSTPLKASGIFPSMILHMLGIGEETGNMEEMLTNSADYYDEEVELTTQQATALMEPLILIVMAGIVCLLIAAIYGPMMSMYEQLG